MKVCVYENWKATTNLDFPAVFGVITNNQKTLKFYFYNNAKKNHHNECC